MFDFAEKLRQIIWSMTDEGKVLSENNQKNIRAYVYEREFRRIKALPEFKELLTWPFLEEHPEVEHEMYKALYGGSKNA